MKITNPNTIKHIEIKGFFRIMNNKPNKNIIEHKRYKLVFVEFLKIFDFDILYKRTSRYIFSVNVNFILFIVLN